MKPLPLSATILSAVSLFVATGASLVTLDWPGAFPPSDASAPNVVLLEGRGWSMVTLLLAVPIGALALTYARRGSLRARLGWLGALVYFVYTYLELAVSGPFTPLYLPYIVTLATALCALIIGASTLDLERLARIEVSRRLVPVFSLVMALGLSAAWLRPILTRTIALDFGWPDAVGSVGHVVHALDLGLVVPLAIATAILVWRRKPGGVVLSSLMSVFSLNMSAALTAMVVSSASLTEGLPFLALFLVAMIVAVVHFRGLAAAALPSPTPIPE